MFIRGTESRHTILLIDGVRCGFGHSGHSRLGRIPVDMIERMKCLRARPRHRMAATAWAGWFRSSRVGPPGLSIPRPQWQREGASTDEDGFTGELVRLEPGRTGLRTAA